MSKKALVVTNLEKDILVSIVYKVFVEHKSEIEFCIKDIDLITSIREDEKLLNIFEKQNHINEPLLFNPKDIETLISYLDYRLAYSYNYQDGDLSNLEIKVILIQNQMLEHLLTKIKSL